MKMGGKRLPDRKGGGSLASFLSAFSVCFGLSFLICASFSERTAAEEIPELSKEEKLVVYTAHKSEIYEPIITEFEARTGIWVEVVSGGTNEILLRLESEGKSSPADVMFGGGVDSLRSYSDLFAPFVPEEADLLDPSYASEESLYVVFSELPTVFICNTKLVPEEQAPKSWEDLLSGDFDGEIAYASPANSGSAYTALLTMLQALPGEEMDILQRFADALGGSVYEESSEIAYAVSSGARKIGITLEEVARKNIENGSDLRMIYPGDGTALLPDGSALLKSARHVENAELFLNFVSGPDVQRYLRDCLFRRPARLDLSGEASFSTISYDMDLAEQRRGEILETFRACLKKSRKSE